MNSYALVDPGNAIAKTAPETKIDPTVQTKAGWRWLPVVPSAAPAHGANEGAAWSYVVSGDTVVQQWQITPRSHSEMAGMVNDERDRRMAVFVFSGKAFDFDERSAMNIAGASTLALAAIINGAQPGDMRWSDADADFGWFAKDNTHVAMDAQTCFAFGQAAASWRSGCIHAARTLKDQSPIPADFTANVHWPS